jgi:hypothetical protein
MRSVTAVGRVGPVVVLAFGLPLGCASAPPPPPPKTAQAVSAIVLANQCATLGKTEAKLAEKEMDHLVDGCATYTGPALRFTATLLPGGAIQFEPRQGETNAIPICVLSHPLKHAVHLAKPCALDVKLEVTSMTVPSR